MLTENFRHSSSGEANFSEINRYKAVRLLVKIASDTRILRARDWKNVKVKEKCQAWNNHTYYDTTIRTRITLFVKKCVKIVLFRCEL